MASNHRAFLFDMEADGLDATKIHCLSYISLNDRPWEVKTITSPKRMLKFFQQKNITLYGHNIWGWDIPTAERLLGFELNLDEATVYDTLGWSWYFFDRVTHGLDPWGEEFGIPKPKISDGEWEGPLPGESQEAFREKMIHRCEEDVKINLQIILACKEKARRIYGKGAKLDSLYQYLSDKQYAYYIKAKNPFDLDLELCEEGLQELEDKMQHATQQLSQILPDVPVYKKKRTPKKPYKKDGSLSASGKSWFDLLEQEGLPKDYEGEVKYISGYKPPNPNSPDQVKDYLFSLGWEPSVYKDSYSKATGNTNSVPQLRVPDGDGGKELPDCIAKLAEKYPQLKVLEDMGMISHRIGLLNGFLSAQKDGKIAADLAGFTNTLRIKHRTLVNLPGVQRDYGELIRGCLKAPDGYELVGCDISGLEDTTKRHYIYPYDPEYVKEQMHPDFDAHVDIAVLANLMTEKEAEWFKACDRYFDAVGSNITPRPSDVKLLRESGIPEDSWGKKKSKLKKVRYLAKTTNFSSVYGVGYKKLAKTLDISEAKAKKILKAYWKRNWSVKEFADKELKKTLVTIREKRTLRGQTKMAKELWVRNPLNKFYYRVRSEKDFFSAINQGTGSYLFEQWVKIMTKQFPKLAFQAHDEVVFIIPKGCRKRVSNWMTKCMEEVNQKYKLYSPLSVKAAFGPDYASVH